MDRFDLFKLKKKSPTSKWMTYLASARCKRSPLVLLVVALVLLLLVMHGLAATKATDQAESGLIATQKWDWVLKEGSYEEFTMAVSLSLYGPEFTGEANKYMLEIYSNDVDRKAGSWQGKMACDRPCSISLAAPDDSTFFGSWDVYFKIAGRKYSDEEKRKGGTHYQYISPEEKKKKEEEQQKVKMLAEALLGEIPIVSDAYTAITLLQAWSKRSPEFALTSDGPGIYLETGEVSKETKDAYAGAHSIFTDEKRLDVHTVIWDKLGDTLGTEQIRYWFTLNAEQTGKTPLYVRTVVPFYWNRLDTSLPKEYYVEIEWQVSITEAQQSAAALTPEVVPSSVSPQKGLVTIGTSPEYLSDVDIQGDTIVWWDKRDNEESIYAWSASRGEWAVCTAPREQRSPAVYGNTIVWSDWRNYGLSKNDIYAWDPVDGERVICENPSSQIHPDIYGDTIVWADGRNKSTHWDIYAWDPVNGERPICTAPGIQNLPAVYGDTIVWQDKRNGNQDIYAWSPTKGEWAVCTAERDQSNPAIYDGTIVWQDRRNDFGDIYARDAVNGERAICTHSGDQKYPNIYGDTIVWVDSRNTRHVEVYAWDPVNGERKICEQKWSQSGPAIWGSTIVWEGSTEDKESQEAIFAFFGWDTVAAREK